MYPKVRVRVEDDDDVTEHQLRLEKFQTIPVENSERYSKGDECGSYHQQCDATMTISYPPLKVSSTISNTSVGKGNRDRQKTAENKIKHNQESSDDPKPYIRANLVPRPRAVLSSPVNDGMVGNQNRSSQAKGTVVRKHEHHSSLQGKLTPKIIQPRMEAASTVGKAKPSPAVITHGSTRAAELSPILVRCMDQKFSSDPKAKKLEKFAGKEKNIV